MKSKFEIFIDTDIFTDHISGKGTGDISLLQKCRTLFDGCYTSVINASEIFSDMTGKRKIDSAKIMFDEIGILGIPFRYSLKIGDVMNAVKKKVQETS